MKLSTDLKDAWNVVRGRNMPQVPVEERTWMRRKAADVYYSDRARRVRFDAFDLYDRVRGRHDPRVPPRRLQFVGHGDFVATGAEFRDLFVRLGGLRPEHDVLDVGSGLGRMAIALSDYVTGRYEGFDIVPEGVAWCRRQITPRHPNFTFQLADIYNGRYNPQGHYAAEDYRFPYDDDSFDFAFLTSVFTHMEPAPVDNYVAELARVLRPGGTCFATYFLINDEARALMSEGEQNFRFDRGDHLVMDEDVPEAAVAFPEERVREVHGARGLPVERVHYGRWCGRTGGTSFQDITISVKAP